MITLIIISAVPIIFLLWVLITYVEHLISLRKYPKGPFPLPLIGNLNLIGGQKIHINLWELSKKYGNVYSISMGKFCKATSIIFTSIILKLKVNLLTSKAIERAVNFEQQNPLVTNIGLKSI